MKQANLPRSIHTLLLQAFVRIAVGMALPILLLGGLLVGLTVRYDAVIADISAASALRGVVSQQLPDEVWRVVSGRIPFEQGRQRTLLAQTQDGLQAILAHTDGSEAQYLGAALRAAGTIGGYMNQLEQQMDAGAAVSRNEALYREIRSVGLLTDSMIDRYTESQITHLGELNTRMQNGLWAAGILLAALLGAIFWSALYISHTADRSIHNSILRLEQMATRIAAGDLSVRAPPAEIEELRRLTLDLNTMAGQIDSLIRERVEQEKTLKKAELRALQAQITPHFMYNTLETIVWLAEEGRNREVVDMTMAFTGFLRISLSCGADFITVEKETQHVANYLQIQSVRYGSIMRYAIDIDPALSHQRILKIILQPLVENAIYHGVKRKRGRSQIRVIGRQEGDSMYFAVEDDGMGMTPERLDEVRRALKSPAPLNAEGSGGYGMRNVAERLRLYCGCELTVESEYRKGTRVSFRLPFDKEEGL